MPKEQVVGTATIRAAAAFDIAELIRKKGHDPQSVFAEAGMSMEAARDPYRQEDLGRYTRLLELAAEVTDSPDFGLTTGIHQNPAKWGAFGYLVLNSPTLGSAMDNLATFSRSWQGGTHIASARTPVSFGLEYSIIHPCVADKDQDAEMGLAYVKHLVDLLCVRRITPDSVHFEHKPISKLSVYLDVLGVEPLFKQPLNCIMFSRSIEKRRVESADLQLFPVLRQHLVDMANAIPRENDLLGLVSHQIRQYLPLHQCTLKDVARALALESQTLQRRLKTHNTVFADMVENIRQEQAVDYLRDNHMDIKEISYLLGYGDPSAFVKAFRRWTGQTPSQYRERKR